MSVDDPWVFVVHNLTIKKPRAYRCDISDTDIVFVRFVFTKETVVCLCVYICAVLWYEKPYLHRTPCRAGLECDGWIVGGMHVYMIGWVSKTIYDEDDWRR